MATGTTGSRNKSVDRKGIEKKGNESAARKPRVSKAATAAPVKAQKAVKAQKSVKAEKAVKVAKKVQARPPKALAEDVLPIDVPPILQDSPDQAHEALLAEVDDRPAAVQAARIPEPAFGGPGTRYLLPANLELANLAAVKQDLACYVEQPGRSFVLDGADLSVIDTGGVQLLVAFVQAMSRQGCEVHWDNYSIQAYQLAEELGLVNYMGD